jgi:hypothetical protein
MPANAVPCRQAKAKYCGMLTPAAAIAVPCRQRLKPTARILRNLVEAEGGLEELNSAGFSSIKRQTAIGF